MNTSKIITLLIKVYAGSLALSLLSLITTVLSTLKWEASRTGKAMMLMLNLDALAFLFGAIILFYSLKGWLPILSTRLLILIGYIGVALVTLFFIMFFSMIIFNR